MYVSVHYIINSRKHINLYLLYIPGTLYTRDLYDIYRIVSAYAPWLQGINILNVTCNILMNYLIAKKSDNNESLTKVMWLILGNMYSVGIIRWTAYA